MSSRVERGQGYEQGRGNESNFSNDRLSQNEAVASLRMFVWCCFFRIVNVLYIQSQFDPDEYWQNLEPAYCGAFGNCDGLTWEWKRRSNITSIDSVSDFIQQGSKGPIRSYVSILPTFLLYHVAKKLRIDSTWVISRGPVFLNAILVAAPTDWSVWYMAKFMTKPEGKEQMDNSRLWYLYASLTSWFNAYALIRTYSNSLETAIFSMSLCLVSPALLGNKNNVPLKWSALSFFLGGICCSVRFTCLVCYIPMGIILAMQQKTRSLFGFIIKACAFPGLLGVIVTLIVDRSFYGFWAIPFLGSLDFNVVQGNGDLYGTHPIYWYLIAGIPAMVGMLLPILILDLFSTWNKGKRNLWIICTCSIILHSCSAHKEFRFLLPLLPSFCLISGDRIFGLANTKRWGRTILEIGALANYVAIVFLGLFHQRGVVAVNQKIVDLVASNPKPTYIIHYLMGCHSTPLVSHLHTPPVKYQTWHLDCSPKCRSNPDEDCESERFSSNPAQFMEESYFQCTDMRKKVGACKQRRASPDFVVIRSSDLLPETEQYLDTMGMVPVDSFPNELSSVTFGGGGGTPLTSFQLFGGAITLQTDNIILFSETAIAIIKDNQQ
ncbi:unnamed protein product [Cylindrotheca closterium]|uniref:Mannosyltransferase n=1 Tax=Cylindrotheca closterium TaxID=2856 RepID=A0AAD2CB40_9STRA|nr:unnamed protein product [Cylindrotheca closterium]